MSYSFLNFLCPMHTLLVSYLYLGSLFHTIEHKFCGLSTGLRFCVKATKFYYNNYYYFIIIIKGLNKRSRLPRRQTLAVGSFPLARDQLTLGTRG